MAPVVAQKLVDAKVNAVVGHFNSGTTIPASKLYSDAGIPQISPSATNPKYTDQGFKTAFRVVANDNQQGKVVGEYIARDLKAKSVAIIDDRTAYGQGVADVVEKSAKAAGVNIVAREFTTDKSTDFKAILTKIRGRKPDVIFFGGIDTQAGPMLQQMKGLGIKAQFVGADGIQSSELFKLGGDAVEGTLASFPGLPIDKMENGKGFNERYKAKFKQDVVLYAPQGYDAFNVFVDAMKKAGAVESAKILEKMPATDYKGITGPIKFDEKGDIKDGPITMFKAVGGKWEAVATIGGAAPAAEAAKPEAAKMDAPKADAKK
jgi:branched-chain amino acid transport system substrate-binding protein